MTRTYSSSKRFEQSRRTRAAVTDAAHQLFVGEGWTATTMAGVAARAGVSRQTVYLLFDSKLALLDQCIDERVAGDDQPVAVRDRPEFQTMGSGDLPTRIEAGARWLQHAHERSAAIQRVLDHAAVTDEDAAARLRQREQARWDEVRWATGLVYGAAVPDDVVDQVWTLASRDVWWKLVVDRGWSPSEWRRWFAATLTDIVAHFPA